MAAWVCSLLVHWTCDQPICHSAKKALGRVYMSIFCILFVIFFKQIQGAVRNVQMLIGEVSKGAKAKAD